MRAMATPARAVRETRAWTSAKATATRARTARGVAVRARAAKEWNVPEDAPEDAFAALRGVRVRSAATGDMEDLTEMWSANDTVVVTFLRSFG